MKHCRPCENGDPEEGDLAKLPNSLLETHDDTVGRRLHSDTDVILLRKLDFDASNFAPEGDVEHSRLLLELVEHSPLMVLSSLLLSIVALIVSMSTSSSVSSISADRLHLSTYDINLLFEFDDRITGQFNSAGTCFG